jgi:hypothetical protein
VRLVRFVRDGTAIGDTYVLEFGSGYIRFYQDGARVATSGVAAWVNATAYAVGDLVTQAGVTYYCVSAHTSATATDRPGDGSAWQTRWYAQTSTIYEIPTPYATADLPDLQHRAEGRHPHDRASELRAARAPALLEHAVDPVEITFGPSIAAPSNVGGPAAAPARFATGRSRRSRKARSRNRSRASTRATIGAVGGVPVALVWDSSARRDLVQRLPLERRTDVRSDQFRRRDAGAGERHDLERFRRDRGRRRRG